MNMEIYADRSYRKGRQGGCNVPLEIIANKESRFGSWI